MSRKTPPLLERYWPVGAITLGSLALSLYYVSSERTFYGWDYAVYHDIATSLSAAFRESFVSGWRLFFESISQDQTALFALPLLPVIRVFGESRLVFIAGLTVLYLVPFALALGSLARRLVPGHDRAVFWTGAVIAVLQPAIWAPTLRGFPDVGAAALVALALDIQFGSRHRLGALGSGMLLALAVLFRRHFLFALPAIAVTLALVTLTDRAPGTLRARTATTARQLALLAVGILSVLLTIGLPFTSRVLARDFYALYSAYLNPPALTTLWFLHQYGWLFLALALAGYVAGLLRGVLDPSWTTVVVGFGLVSWLQWVAIVRQVGESYLAHFTPIVVLGLTAGACTLARALLSKRMRRLGYAAGSVLLLWNLMLGLSDWGVAYRSYPGRALFAANWAPLVRFDYAQVRDLVAFLRVQDPPGDICVVGSSLALSWSVLQAADRALRPPGAPPLRIVRMPEIDSRDRYPLGPLLQARYVLLVRPLQLHLAPGEQEVVKAAYDLFDTSTRFAADFEHLPKAFRLSQGMVVEVFRRLRPTPAEVSLEVLRTMEAAVVPRPGTQPDWEILGSSAPFWTDARANGATRLVAHPARRGHAEPTRALYLPSSSRRPRVSGDLTFADQRCLGVAVVFGGLSAGGKAREATEIIHRQGDAVGFGVEVPLETGEQLMLTLTNPAGQANLDYCLVILDPLTVTP